ncbi:uncharacterized protein LOC130776260 [Actinidia eriantha]|uniref:uncharacterized protein LOC130776260 n=1 Tax=Actinidia eriantha TaxID=165200 RepID=UPI0025875AAE|nr:uncharacterized protein LOC130776260 [Actinidia eriantha]
MKSLFTIWVLYSMEPSYIPQGIMINLAISSLGMVKLCLYISSSTLLSLIFSSTLSPLLKSLGSKLGGVQIRVQTQRSSEQIYRRLCKKLLRLLQISLIQFCTCTETRSNTLPLIVKEIEGMEDRLPHTTVNCRFSHCAR